jgi:integrase
VEIKRFWASACRQAGIEGVRLHDLRHTYASVLVSSGLSLPIIGALLGHSQAATTQRYAHLMDDPLRRATALAARVITGEAA